MEICSVKLRAKVLERAKNTNLNILIYKRLCQSWSVCLWLFGLDIMLPILWFLFPIFAHKFFLKKLMSGSFWCGACRMTPQDPFVTHNARIVRFVILSQTLVLGDPVCTKQVPGQYRELVLIMWTAFIPRLTNSSRGSFAHLLHWRRCKRYISKTVFFQLENLCFECRCFSLAESHVYQSWVSIFVH